LPIELAIGDWRSTNCQSVITLQIATIQSAIVDSIPNRRFVDRQSPICSAIGNCQSPIGNSRPDGGDVVGHRLHAVAVAGLVVWFRAALVVLVGVGRSADSYRRLCLTAPFGRRVGRRRGLESESSGTHGPVLSKTQESPKQKKRATTVIG
jgi:hypothetical protein